MWKVGDWAVVKSTREIGKIKRFSLFETELTKLGGYCVVTACNNLRPLTDADWTREIDGVKYRAYWDDLGSLILYGKLKNGDKENFCYDDYSAYESFCRLAGIPIMPYELSKGNYEYPI